MRIMLAETDARTWVSPRSKFVPVAMAALAVGLSLPALGAGWILDDYYHRTVMRPDSPYRELLGTPNEMFRFFRGDPARTTRMMDAGLFPWWTDPTLKAEFLQALTVLTHRVDYALWPESAALMHAHNLVWLAAAVAAVAALYRQLHGATWMALIAATLYAVDDCHGPVVGFIANRNALIAATFGVLAIIGHDRARRAGSVPAALAAPCLLLAALFAKEEGIGTCAYLAAYALFVDRAGRGRALVALWPHAVAVVCWRVLRGSWGYGVENVGLYIDPLTDPGPFALALLERVPLLLMGLWSTIPAEAAVVLRPPYSTALYSAAVGFAAMLLIVLLPLLTRDRLARFWGAGMLFALVPVSATLPMDRLLTFSGIGASALLAQFLASVFDPSREPLPGRRWAMLTKIIAWLLVVVHLVWAPLVLPFRAANPIGASWIDERFYPHTPLNELIVGKTLVLVNAPSPVHGGYTLFRRFLNGDPIPRHVRVLAPAVPAVTIRRLDAHTLEIRPESGYIDWVLDRIFRSEYRPMSIGEEVRLTGMTARIGALTRDNRPAVATFRFDVPLESDSLVWLCFRGRGFEPFVPPPIGGEAMIRFDLRAVMAP